MLPPVVAVSLSMVIFAAAPHFVAPAGSH